MLLLYLVQNSFEEVSSYERLRFLSAFTFFTMKDFLSIIHPNTRAFIPCTDVYHAVGPDIVKNDFQEVVEK